MLKRPRRRPGERAYTSRVLGRGGYNLDEDKLIRTNAKFNGFSLGKSSLLYSRTTYNRSPAIRSYISKEEHPTIINDELSVSEIELMYKIKDYEDGYDIPLKVINPRVYEKVIRVLVESTKERLVKVRRARHTPGVLNYVRYLDSLPRNRTMSLTDELYAGLPY
jgi:hypothetical protein